MQRHENGDTPRRKNTSKFPSRRAELNALSEIRIGDILGSIPPKGPQRGIPAKSSNSNRTGDTEPAPVN
jgi:hypothetical protein